ncbi:unnamed protein product [Caenorhabditis brenneri]
MDASPNMFCGAELGGWIQWIASWRNDSGNRENQDLQVPQLANLTIEEQPNLGRQAQNTVQLRQPTAVETAGLTEKNHQADETQTEPYTHISSLPDKVLKLMMDRMKTTDRLRFRGVSPQYRSLSDSHPFHIKDLKLSFDRTGSKLELNQRFYNFLPVMGSPDKTAHVTVALQRLLSLLRTPNLQLERLQIEQLEFDKADWQEVTNNVVDELRRFHVILCNQIHLKKLEIRWNSTDVLEEFLPIFDPQTLEHIKYDVWQRVWSCFEYDVYDNERLFMGLPVLSEFRQWKEAKTVELYAGVPQIMAGENIDSFYFFNEVHLNFGRNDSQSPEFLTMVHDEKIYP